MAPLAVAAAALAGADAAAAVALALGDALGPRALGAGLAPYAPARCFADMLALAGVRAGASALLAACAAREGGRARAEGAAPWAVGLVLVSGMCSLALALAKAALRWPAPGHAGGADDVEAGLWWAMAAWTATAGAGALWVARARVRAHVRQRSSDLEDPLLGGESQEGSGGGRAGAVRKLAKLSAPDWHVLAGASFFLVVGAVANAAVPRFSGGVVNAVSFGYDRSAFRTQLCLLTGAAVVNGIGSGCRGALFLIQIARLNRRVRERLMEALLAQDLSFYDVTPLGDITSRMNNDTSKLTDTLGLNTNVLLRNLVSIAFLLGFMLHLEPRLTLLTFAVVPVATVTSKVYGTFYRKKTKETQTSLAEAGTVADETLGALATIRSFAAEELMAAAYSEKLETFYVLQKIQAYWYIAYMATMTALPQLSQALVLLYGGHLVLEGRTQPGTLVSFLLYQQTLSSAFSNLGDVYSQMMQALGAADKVLELLERVPLFDNRSGAVRPLECRGEVALVGVQFQYPGRDRVVLKNFSLCVKPGECCALCGPSGGGKSSIVKLIQRFYEPDLGRVLFDGRDLHTLDAHWLKRQIGLVGQEPVLLARSVRENILFGLEGEGTTEEMEARMIKAAQRANAHAFVSALPDGYETQCGEKGTMLSGGQKQRIAIARALVREPRLLLLDEATSALDAESEALVQAALEELMTGRTTLVVAHRLSTIAAADRIVVVEGGEVAEAGTHEDLIRRDGTYAQLVRRQLGGGSSRASKALLMAGGEQDDEEGAEDAPPTLE